MARGETVTILTPDGAMVVVIPRRSERSKVARHLNAIRRYLELGDFLPLLAMAPLFVETADHGSVELVTDVATIDRLAIGGEVWFELYVS
jgi:hypothetical protein